MNGALRVNGYMTLHGMTELWNGDTRACQNSDFASLMPDNGLKVHNETCYLLYSGNQIIRLLQFM